MHLRQAVHRQMVADVPVGAFLSGGLDSSSVVAFARELNPDIRCFSIDTVGDLEEGATDDLPYARRVAQHLGVSLDVVQIDVNSMASDLEGMVAQLDEPLADPAPLNVLYISQLARKNGIKVLLSGTGGDDLFTGYRRHRALQAEHYWSWLPLGLRSGMRQMTSRLDQHRAWTRRLAKLFDGAAMDGDARTINYFRWSREVELLGLYTPEFRHAVAGELASAPMLDFLRPLPASVSPLERMLALEQRFFLADHNLIYTDKMSMASGVEVRVPFLDLDLVEFAARIPTSLKQRGREGKWVLKKAMEPYLPHDVIYRPKTGFGAPLRHWMRHNLHELVGDLMSADSLKRRGFFEPAAVQKLIAANYAGKVDASYTLLSLMSIEIWCRTYLDKPVCGADYQRLDPNNVAILGDSNELDASQLLVKRIESETSKVSGGIEFHDGIAAEWSDGYVGGSFKRRHDVILKLIDQHVVSGENWLDLGCGSGVFSQELVNRGAAVVAVDGSSEMLKHARSIFGSEKLRWLQSDVQSISQLSDRTFDGVFCSSVVEYLDRPEAALAEAARLLRPNGKLIVSLPPTMSVVRWGQKLIRAISLPLGGNLFPYLAVSRFELEPTHLTKWLSDAGFVLDQVNSFDPLLPRNTLSYLRPALLIVEAHKR